MSLLFQVDTDVAADDSLIPAVPPFMPKGLVITPIFDTFWRFAAERQNVFFRRACGASPPWTVDPILGKYKFTNAYRSADRVSQYLIRNVIYSGEQSPQELFFRIVLFKLFNRIETWERLRRKVQHVSWSEFSFETYDSVLTSALEEGSKIYSAAYIMPSGGKSDRKHRHHLRMLEMMMRDEVPLRIQDSRSMREAFEVLRSYASVGDFLAYQFITDLNYSELVNFSERGFVKAGPGARDGIRKCFVTYEGYSPEDLIRWMVETQEAQFARLGIRFRSLWGRQLQMIDCQNLFCEVDKYSRQAFPAVVGISGRTRIKQRFRPNVSLVNYFFPPKWNINHTVEEFGGEWDGGCAPALTQRTDVGRAGRKIEV